MFGTGGYHLFLSPGYINAYQTVLAVGVEDGAAVGHPLDGADVGVVIVRQLAGFATFNSLNPHLGLTGTVADVGHLLTVGTDGGIALMGAGGARETAGDALVHGEVEHLATGGDVEALAVG